jgi:hypothetical protein
VPSKKARRKLSEVPPRFSATAIAAATASAAVTPHRAPRVGRFGERENTDDHELGLLLRIGGEAIHGAEEFLGDGGDRTSGSELGGRHFERRSAQGGPAGGRGLLQGPGPLVGEGQGRQRAAQGQARRSEQECPLPHRPSPAREPLRSPERPASRHRMTFTRSRPGRTVSFSVRRRG